MPDSGLPHVDVNWNQVVIGGGGLVTGIDIAADGTKVCRTDVGGCYVKETNWVQMLTQIKAPIATFNGYRSLVGVFDIAIASNNSDYIYFIYKNQVWKSADGGLTSAATNYTANTTTDGSSNQYFGANVGNYKQIQGKVAVDPSNHLVVYASNPGGKMQVTVDGGTTWGDAPDVDIGTGFGAGCITFDPSGGTTGGKTNNIWVAIVGSGVWRSTDAGVSFTLIDAALNDIVPHGNSAISSDGAFYLSWSNGSTRTLSRYQSGSFSTIKTNTNGIKVAAHPTTAGVVCAMTTNAMGFSYSSNYGTPFTDYTQGNQTWTSADAIWQAANINAGFGGSIARIKFDPNDANKLWMTGGQGVWSATITAGVAPSWQTTVIGIEELVVNDLSQESGTALFQTVFDESCFKHETNALSTPPSAPIWGASSTLKLSSSFSIDPANTQQMVIGGTSTCSGYSTNGGGTWTLFPTMPTGFGTTYSNICINDGIIIWVQPNSGQGYPWRSDDWGTTWTALNGISDIPGSGNTGWSSTISVTRHTICADRVNPDVFYMYNYLSGQTPAIRGVWKSSDRGLTWALQATPGPYSNTNANVYDIKCVPGVESYLFATCGHNTNATHPTSYATFVKSSDGGINWTTVANVLEVNKFCFGKFMPGSAYPTLYIAGFHSSVYGIYRSTDLGASWVQYWSDEYNEWPIVPDVVTCMEGDKDVEGRVYIGFQGTGAVSADLAAITGTCFGLQF